MASLFGEGSPESGRCPGDTCSRYRSAAEPKINACKLCPDCNGRGPLEKSDADDKAIIEHIRRLALERESCPHIFSARELSDLEFELLLAWTDARDWYELSGQRKQTTILEALMKMPRL